MKRLAFLIFGIATMASALAASRSIVVAQDGKGDFTSIVAAMDSIKDASKENPVTIHIRPGTYHETFTMKDWVNLEGDNRERCIIDYDSGTLDDKVIAHAHVIWASANCTIKNLTLIGRRVKYCIHADGAIPLYYDMLIENCTLIRPRGNNFGYPSTIGTGQGGGENIVMRNCLLESDQPVRMHNRDNNGPMPCSMTLEKCTLNAYSSAGLALSSHGGSGQDKFIIRDCVFKGAENPIVSLSNDQAPIQILGSNNVFETPPTVSITDDSSPSK